MFLNMSKIEHSVSRIVKLRIIWTYPDCLGLLDAIHKLYMEDP
jgi:hypothetical protein